MAHKFNDVEIRTPTSFEWDMEDIEAGNGFTSQDGVYHFEILAQKRNLSYQWTDPSAEEVSSILTLINQDRIISVTYPDAMSNEYETRNFKIQKRSAPFRSLRVGAKMYSALSIDLKEV